MAMDTRLPIGTEAGSSPALTSIARRVCTSVAKAAVAIEPAPMKPSPSSNGAPERARRTERWMRPLQGLGLHRRIPFRVAAEADADHAPAGAQVVARGEALGQVDGGLARPARTIRVAMARAVSRIPRGGDIDI